VVALLGETLQDVAVLARESLMHEQDFHDNGFSVPGENKKRAR
jgi:hypothetical protein